MYERTFASWRKRVLQEPLLLALVLSVLIHVGIIGIAYFFPGVLGLKPGSLSSQLKQLIDKHVVAVTPPKNDTKKAKELEPAPQEMPLIFVEVDPSQLITEEPSKNPKYYSNKNTKAANPDPQKNTDTPKIDGQQEHVVKTRDVARPTPPPKAQPLQPSPPKQQVTKAQTQPETPVESKNEQPTESKQEKTAKVEAVGGKPVGNLAMAKPSNKPAEKETQGKNGNDNIDAPPPPKRPRTLAEALARQQDEGMAGKKMKQDGGVQRSHIVPSLDAKATPFGDYDAMMISAIQTCWYNKLDEIHFSSDRKGRVVLEFRLYYDGHVENMTTVETTVGDFLALICQRAVLEPSPYEKWPPELRKVVGADYRDVRFTFYYD